jgi:UDP-N-acetylmuramoylalanine--D-glutamate ligase
MTHVRNQRVTVLGLGHFGGGIAVSRWLVEQGATVTVVDDAPAERLADSVAQLAGLPIDFRLGPDQPLAPADLIVASPAIPPHHPQLIAARAAGAAVTTEICLFAERCPAPVFGVTGTKGKSTTSTLLARMLGAETWLGGNIGRSLLADLPAIRPDGRVVLELSSFMLQYLGERAWSPHVAIVTMVTRDHLDWHGSVGGYVDAKRQIVRHQTAGDTAVLNRGDPASVELAALTLGHVVYFNGEGDRPFDLRLPGGHNQLNAQAAFAAAATAGVTWAAAQAAIADFAGLPHRLEVVADVAGVRWVNDSIATIPEAAVAALGSFPAGRVIQIVGGSGKKALDTAPLCAALAGEAKAVLCIGETGETLAAEVNRRAAGRARACGDLATAVAAARALAVAGDVVLLSPGHPSYDQFVNFQQRGEMYARLAQPTS